MSEEIMEEFFSGFCRTCNGMQSVTCEYRQTEEGVVLEVMDCAHKKCQHHAACEIYRQAHEQERTGR
ncbi:MAG: hypothetical protein ACOYBE_08155 [Blautia sp.]|jgi:hypothetical protein